MISTTPVSKCLDKKIQVLGYEVPDLLAIFLLLGILNFLFGQTDSKLLFVWGPTLAAALFLKIVKKDKPDNFLIHFSQYHANPKFYSAFPSPQNSYQKISIRREDI